MQWREVTRGFSASSWVIKINKNIKGTTALILLCITFSFHYHLGCAYSRCCKWQAWVGEFPEVNVSCARTEERLANYNCKAFQTPNQEILMNGTALWRTVIPLWTDEVTHPCSSSQMLILDQTPHAHWVWPYPRELEGEHHPCWKLAELVRTIDGPRNWLAKQSSDASVQLSPNLTETAQKGADPGFRGEGLQWDACS